VSGTEPDFPRYGDYEARSRATQQHILDVAVEVLAELGYSGASTLKIQERAGVSRGRLLHHYPHRDELLVASVQHIAEARVATAGGHVDWPTDPGARVDAAVGALWATYHEGYFWAATELWLAARSNYSLAEALAPREHALGAAIRTAIDEMFGRELVGRPGYADVRDVLNSSMRGVALTYAFDPRDPAADPHLASWKRLSRGALGVSDRS
jgi:AcrR family transcriptional regulator